MKTAMPILLFLFVSMLLSAQTTAEWFNQKATQKKYLIQQIAALQVYIGYLQKGGTRIRQLSAIDSTIVLDYSVKFNEAAINSIKQAVNF